MARGSSASASASRKGVTEGRDHYGATTYTIFHWPEAVQVDLSVRRRSFVSSALLLPWCKSSVVRAQPETGAFRRYRVGDVMSYEVPQHWSVTSQGYLGDVRSSAELGARRALPDAQPNGILAFGAGRSEQPFGPIAWTNVTLYPEEELEYTMFWNEMRGLDRLIFIALESALRQAASTNGNRVIEIGTTWYTIDGLPYVLTGYRRTTSWRDTTAVIRIARLWRGRRSFSMTVGYDSRVEQLLRGISDYMIDSVRAI